MSAFAVYNPTTSTQSPSSKPASPIAAEGLILSPSICSTGSAFPLFRDEGGYLFRRPADFKKAFTIAPHVVVGRTVKTISLVVIAERRVNLNFSPPMDSGSDPRFNSSSESSEPA